MRSRMRALIIPLILLALLISGFAAAAASESLTLAENGETHYRVYTGSTENLTVKYAGEELARYLGQVTGATFLPASAQADPSEQYLLLIGRNELAVELCPNLADEALGEDGFAFCTAGDDLVIAGATARGTLYGVYYLLDYLVGVRWFSQSYTFVPSVQTLQLAKTELNRVEVPRFDYRDIMLGDSANPQYRHHNMLNSNGHISRNGILAPPELNTWYNLFADKNHNFHEVVPKEVYQSTHPEYFAGGQLATMNEEVRQIATDYFLNKIKNTPEYEQIFFGFSQEDSGWRPDTASSVFAFKHGGAEVAPILDMVVDVADRVREKYPAAKFSTLAYGWSTPPPKNMQVPNYVAITVAPIRADHGRSMVGTVNAEFRQYIAGWSEIAENLLIWDYIINHRNWLHPYPNLDAMFQTIQGLAAYPSVRGYFGQGTNGTEGIQFAELRSWVGARLLWNPNQDYHALVDEFLQGYYGDAAPYVAEYIDLLHKAFFATGQRLGTFMDLDAPYLSFDVMRLADTLMAKAAAAVSSQADFARHVAEVRLGVDYVILQNRRLFASQATNTGVTWDADLLNRLTRLKVEVADSKVSKLGPGQNPPTLTELYGSVTADLIQIELPEAVTVKVGVPFSVRADVKAGVAALADAELTVTAGLVEGHFVQESATGFVAELPGLTQASELRVVLRQHGVTLLAQDIQVHLTGGTLVLLQPEVRVKAGVDAVVPVQFLSASGDVVEGGGVAIAGWRFAPFADDDQDGTSTAVFRNLAPGTHVISISAPGYGEAEVTVVVETDS